jgi:hypothetical protein
LTARSELRLVPADSALRRGWATSRFNPMPQRSGEGGIRTLGALADSPVFETGTFGHSATSPSYLTRPTSRTGYLRSDDTRRLKYFQQDISPGAPNCLSIRVVQPMLLQQSSQPDGWPTGLCGCRRHKRTSRSRSEQHGNLWWAMPTQRTRAGFSVLPGSS